MIDMTKKYRTKTGVPVRIVCTDVKGDYPVLALIKSCDRELSYGYTSDLKFNKNFDSDNDLVEVIPYEDFNVDDKVLVWNVGGEKEKKKRHFAGLGTGGDPLVWRDGETSFTRTSIPTSWDFCEKYVEG